MIEIPEIPKQIINAINDGTLAVFVGAGVSRIAGLPGWNDLAKDLISKCNHLGLIEHVDKEIILGKIKDNKQLVTIAYTMLCEHGKEETFFEVLSNFLKKDSISEPGKQVFKWLKDTTALVLTTNADLLLDQQYEKNRIFSDVNSAANWSTSRGSLVHLHGIITDRISLVFTVKQYIERYRSMEYKEYLKKVFNTKTVLFIGYGLAEFELLDYIIQHTAPHIRHFILSPYLSYEEPAIRAMNQYYNELGITQISYCIDKNGHSDLAQVLTCWMDRIMRSTNLPSITIKRLRELCAQAPTIDITAEATQLAKTNSVAEKELFTQILRSKYKSDWLISLQDSFCFDPAVSNPRIEKVAAGGKEQYRSPLWFGIEALAQVIHEEPTDKLKKMAADVLNRMSANAIKDELKIDNWISAHYAAELFFSVEPKCIEASSWKYMRLVSKSRIADNMDTFTLEFVRQVNAITKWPAVYLCKSLEIMLDRTVKRADREYDYSMDELTKKCLDIVAPIMYGVIIKLCIKSIGKAFKHNPLTFADVGAIAKYPDNNGYEDFDNLSFNAAIIIWLRKSISIMTTAEALRFATEYRFSDIPLLRRAAIYSISCHFAACSDFLFSTDNNNPFDDNEIYSDLFDMLASNSCQIDKTYLEKITIWINHTNFGTENIHASNFRRALIYRELSKNNPEYLSLWSDYSNSVGHEYDRMEAYNVSKLIYGCSAEWVQPDPSIAKQMENMGAQEIIEYLNNIECTWRTDEWDIGKSIEIFIPEHPSILLDNPGPFLELKEGLLPYLIRAMEKMDITEECCYEIWPFLHDVLIRWHNDRQLSVAVFRAVRELFISKKRKAFFDAIARAVMTWTDSNKPYYKSEMDYDMVILNDQYALAVSLLIDTAACAKESGQADVDNYVLDFINNRLDDANDWILRMTLGFQMADLQYLSHKWTDERLPLIFNNVNPVAVSIGYIQGRFWTPDLYKYLSSCNYFKDILSLTDDATTSVSQMKQNIAAISIRALISNDDMLGKEESTLNSVISNLTDSMMFSAIKVFKNDLSKEIDASRKANIGSKLSLFLQAIKADAEWKNNQWVYSLMDCLAALSIISNKLWDAVERLISSLGDIWVDDKVYLILETTVARYPLRTVRLMEIFIVSNSRAYVSDDYQKIISRILGTLKSGGYGEEALHIRNILISKGYPSFADA